MNQHTTLNHHLKYPEITICYFAANKENNSNILVNSSI